ncbi:putative Mesoderm induction early response protein 1 [Hypsibius exemplaris]|uniref:Mesoderm induction early response protein 1 n=1 Tax=Hypsibius exemplaris TaxID=2072580 RepID=A0A1W0WTP8_HYPEX|nr:putative Mesoderm induction early response protein 1 [Hypsibius exemplaris]
MAEEESLTAGKDLFVGGHENNPSHSEFNFSAMESVAEPTMATGIVAASKLASETSLRNLPTAMTNDETLHEPEKLPQQQGEDASDQAYQPTLEDALDDEATMEDEETNGDADDGELDELERLGELPLEELLRMYGGGGAAAVSTSVLPLARPDSAENVAGPSRSQNRTNDESAPLDSSKISNDEEDWTTSSEDEDGFTHGSASDAERAELMKFLARIGHDKTAGGGEDSGGGSSSDDDEFIPVHLMMLKREVPIGPNRQVEPPTCDAHYEEVAAELTDEVLQWAPRLPEADVIDYLKAAYIQERELLKKEIPSDQLAQTDVADDEEFLKELLDCNYEKEEALRRCRRNFRPGRYESSKWSEKECEDFESAIMENWKRFNIVQAAVPTRTVKEVVEFYYRWKKSGRYEPFIARVRVSDGKTHHNLEEKVKLRLNGKKRPLDAMDSVAEDQLADSEKEKVPIEPRPKSARLDSINSAASSSGSSGSAHVLDESPAVTQQDRFLAEAGPSGS